MIALKQIELPSPQEKQLRETLRSSGMGILMKVLRSKQVASQVESSNKAVQSCVGGAEFKGTYESAQDELRRAQVLESCIAVLEEIINQPDEKRFILNTLN